MSYAIVTDSAANLPRGVVERYGITVIPLSYYLEGEEHICLDSEEFDGHSFYAALAAGAKARTSQITPQLCMDKMEPLLKQGLDLLFVGLSSGVSGSFASAQSAAIQLAEEYPERKIELLDTLGASLGEGLQVIWACEYREAGKSLEEAAALLTARRARMCQLFTVDDLLHLRKTGRISGVIALVGTVLNIKPMLKGDETGHIVNCGKVRGRKQALRALAEKYDALVEHSEGQIVGISHADCLEDAKLLADMIGHKHPPREIMIVPHEPVTGVHVGPGMLAVYFEGGEDARLK